MTVQPPRRRLRVALFVTCFNDTVWPRTVRATVTLLERLGCEVEVPQAQTCCGQMFTNTGYFKEAVPLVRGFVDTFQGFDHVVAPSGSCVSSIRLQHPMLARRVGDPGLASAADAVVPNVRELSEFVVDVLGVTDVGARFPHTVAYHPTCHSLRMLRVGDRPRQLLEAVEGVRLVDLADADECCGFGGTFALKNSDTSLAMGRDKADSVVASGAEVLVSSDNSCLAHIGGVLARRGGAVRVLHLAEILASQEA